MIEEEHEATESEGDDSGEDLYASFSTEVLRSISLSPRRGGNSSQTPTYTCTHQNPSNCSKSVSRILGTPEIRTPH